MIDNNNNYTYLQVFIGFQVFYHPLLIICSQYCFVCIENEVRLTCAIKYLFLFAADRH